MEKAKHKVLALKYRPKNFNELIGQNVMVDTITNSIKSDTQKHEHLHIPHHAQSLPCTYPTMRKV